MKRLLLIGLVGLSLVGCSNGNELTEEQLLERQQRTEQIRLEKQQREALHEQTLQAIVESYEENPRLALINLMKAANNSGEVRRVLYSFKYNYESNHNLGVLTSETYELESGYFVQFTYCRNGDTIVSVSEDVYGDSIVSRRF